MVEGPQSVVVDPVEANDDFFSVLFPKRRAGLAGRDGEVPKKAKAPPKRNNAPKRKAYLAPAEVDPPTLLLSLIDQLFEKATPEEVQHGKVVFARGGLSFFTACSGTDQGALVAEELGKKLGGMTTQRWACEMEAFKRKFIIATSSKPIPVFLDVLKVADALTAGTGSADTQWGTLLLVQKADFAICCCSCKDLSSLKTSIQHALDKGTTGATLRAILKLVDKLRPKYLVMENVPNFVSQKAYCFDDDDDEWKNNLESLRERLWGINYIMRWTALRPHEVGVPLQRPRVFPISADSLQDPEAPLTLENTFNTLKRLTSNIQMLALEQLLFPEDHPEVEKARRQASAEARRTENAELLAEAPAKGALWVFDHQGHFEAKGLEWIPPIHHKGNKGPHGYSDELAQEPFYKVRTDREKHVIAFYDQFDVKPVVLDLNINLKWGKSFCVTPGSRLWHWEKRRLLLGAEKMQLQLMIEGSYRNPGLSQSQLGDLAGNAVSNACMAAVLASLFLTW